MKHIYKNRIITHNNKSEINDTFLFSHEMSIALIHRPLNFCLLMQHTQPCYIVGHEPGEYGKDLMKIKFNSDDNLSLNKILKLHMLTVIVRSVFQADNKYYPHVFLDECLYEL